MSFDAAGFAAAARGLFLERRGDVAGSGLALQLYKLFHCEGRFAAELVQPRALAVWQGGFDFQPPLTLAGRAAEDGALKLVFQTADGHRVESVLIAMPGGNGAKATLCLSSQVGCAMGCAFCRTGTMGLIRDLRAEEIVAQAWLARRQLGLSFGNLVFMGMGEPLDNLAGLAQALRVLTDGSGLAFGQERVTVCTCGHVDGLRAFAALGYKRIGLSVSLNAPDDATRSRLMTVNRRWPLAALEAALLAYPRRRNFYFALNYCLIPGVNDSAEAAAGVAAFARRVGRCLVNLIPYNPGGALDAPSPTDPEIERFLGWLKAAGVEARRRGAKGQSIMAACGQLGGPADQVSNATCQTVPASVCVATGKSIWPEKT
ncbi:MAG: hypothetical protein A2087_04390 [Spirochaetes bacterium GWD1_61_31]|nr:MAG: hypothetical protein A2Y37_10950 [Spirochaetes bacterium GWB1_60_80]OHD33711.1 MAG: hypothetical protein A2004_09740 [Spirochaetes bacterium GWC1_61_12]OHD35447.1 MAG: hypothetical protein A2087_04390 [Spirochaetes bacterium GWD1_61_31]OHD44955.1 MAG: hypothetical protein A2Y35_12990 [Spirochaetes bacterium GWE1_60_18]OHD60065.1 MAG: hypothetical protein A2Y32_11105 [Spirochaetes bacterium GWF1_60_12]